MTMRLAYRMRQFWQALRASPGEKDLADARLLLGESLFTLFRRMQPSEQAHSLNVYRHLVDQGLTNRDLLVAALLHDVGKSRYPLNAWERTLIVLGQRFLPSKSRAWGEPWSGRQPPELSAGWRKPFIVAAQHPIWGAQMADQAGAPPLAVRLIRRHQDHIPAEGDTGRRTIEDLLLLDLQSIDENN
jgi:hypothetical protein